MAQVPDRQQRKTNGGKQLRREYIPTAHAGEEKRASGALCRDSVLGFPLA